MAAIRPRRRTNGALSYTVRWRLGGARDGAWQSETFHARQAARDFKLDVEDAGHQWPAGWVKGVGYVRVADEPDTPAGRHRLADFGREYAEQRTGIGPDTRTAYLGRCSGSTAGWRRSPAGRRWSSTSPPTTSDAW